MFKCWFAYHQRCNFFGICICMSSEIDLHFAEKKHILTMMDVHLLRLKCLLLCKRLFWTVARLCSVLSITANGHGWWEEQKFMSDPMAMCRNNIFNMYFNPCIVPWISLYRPMVMGIWIKNRSCPHGHGLNGEPMAMGGGNNTNACEFAWSCAKNFFPSNSVEII